MKCTAIAGSIAMCVAFGPFAAGLPPEPKATKIEPHAWEGSKRVKVARIEGSADEKGERYVLTNLTTLMPVAIGVEAKNPGDTFTLSLFKSGWKDAKRQVSTSASPLAVSEFRTYGDVQVLVTSASGKKPFVLRVVVGQEARRPMKAAYVPMDEYRKRHPEAFSSWRSPALMAGVLILLLAAAGGVFYFTRRRKT